MLKVFLVEDEIIMREGIKKNIDWEGEGFDFVGDASDGELAYPMIQKMKPDILISDIKMPFMDGLELSRLVKQELPDTKIILLSGYDEFEYAKEAIEIGITDYLLKPISGAELIKVIKGVGQKIEAERAKKVGTGKTSESKFAERQRLFRHIVSGKYSFSEVLKEAKEQKIELAADQYNIMLLQLFSEAEEEAAAEKQKNFEQLLEEISDNTENIIVAKQSRSEYDLLLKGNDTMTLEDMTEYVKCQLENFFNNEKKLEYVAAIGTPVERFSELKQCYEKANLCFSKRYSVEKNQILKDEPKDEIPVEILEDVKLGELNISGLNRKQVEQFLYTGTIDEISDFVETYFAQIGSANVQSILLRQYVMMDLYVVAASVLEKSGYKGQNLVERCGDAKDMAAYLTSIEQTKDYIKNLFETVIKLREASADNKYESMMLKAKAYIDDNFEKDWISLNSVAAAVNLSPSHFSTIFGQEMGETFVEYLTRIRMEKAKELLRTTGMKATDIAFEVGYRDAHYFSNLFKKTQGCTPREYRNRA